MFQRLRYTLNRRQLLPVVVVVGLLLGAVGWWHYSARPVELTAEQIPPVLSDHSLLGAWGSSSRKYALYLAPDGAAVYQEQGQAVTQGTWLLEADGKVCLAFAGIATNCYGVGRADETLVWILPGSGRTYPFVTRPGRIEGL